MIKLFRKIRQKLLTENSPNGRAGKTSKYLLYAIGEIVLVVIGILIALQINNWNEIQKQESKIKKIYANIQNDLNSDVKEFDKIIKSITARIPYYKKVIDDKMTLEDYKTCYPCWNLLSGFKDIFIEKGGFNLLLENSALFESQKDNNLFTKINKFYSLHDLKISISQEEMAINYHDNRSYFKKNKPWFKEKKSSKLMDDKVDYMLNSWDYKNRVKSTYSVESTIYLSQLIIFRNDAQELIEIIDTKLQYEIEKGWFDRGQLKWEGKWKHGEKIGIHTSWFKNGQLKDQGLWRNGRPDDLHKKWFENGQLKEEKTFKNNIPNGVLKSWYENGQLKVEVTFKNGRRYGTLNAWHENGQLSAEIPFKDGKQEGMKAWFKNGQLASEIPFKDGKKEGVLKGWHENGQLSREQNWSDGILISEIVHW